MFILTIPIILVDELYVGRIINGLCGQCCGLIGSLLYVSLQGYVCGCDDSGN